MTIKHLGRNFIIAFLMVLAIYQTGKLWFEDISDHNFFNFSGKSESTGSMFYTLDRILVNTGDNRVVSIGSGIYTNEYKKTFDKAVTEALSKGSISENTGNLDWNSVLDNRAVIYGYDCSFGSGALESLFNVKSESLGAIKSFDTIVISPRADNSYMRVIFFDSVNKTSATAELKSSSVIGECFDAGTRLADRDEDIYYISSAENGFDIFSENIFLPRCKSENYSYNAVEPHFTANDIQMIEENANIFFNNAIAGNYTRNSDGYTFSDETTVVKFSENDVMEYFSYDTKHSSGNSLADNMSAALNMIEQDKFVTNEVYLHSYSYADGQFTFLFNYKLNDLKLLPSEEIKKKTGLSSFIEVSVSQGSVDRYRKYTCRYTLSDKNIQSAKIDFIGAIDKLYSQLYKGSDDKKPVDDMTLVYMAEDKSFGLSWTVDIDGREYVVDI